MNRQALPMARRPATTSATAGASQGVSAIPPFGRPLAARSAPSVRGSLRPSGDRSPSLVPLVTRFAPSVRLKATGLAFLDQLPGTVHLLTLAVLEEPVS
jgi:hypothetical protein